MRPNLRIVGHYNPFGEYPSPVVPICEDNRKRLFAIYRRELRPVPPTLDYVQHAPDLVAAMSDFVTGRNALFAFDSDRVVSINRRHQARFYADLLNTDDLSSCSRDGRACPPYNERGQGAPLLFGGTPPD